MNEYAFLSKGFCLSNSKCNRKGMQYLNTVIYFKLPHNIPSLPQIYLYPCKRNTL